jgi:hypothetical protein
VSKKQGGTDALLLIAKNGISLHHGSEVEACLWTGDDSFMKNDKLAGAYLL